VTTGEKEWAHHLFQTEIADWLIIDMCHLILQFDSSVTFGRASRQYFFDVDELSLIALFQQQSHTCKHHLLLFQHVSTFLNVITTTGRVAATPPREWVATRVVRGSETRNLL